MPKGFNKCVDNGGRVMMIEADTHAGNKLGLKDGQYCHVCIDKKGGFYKGEVHKKKTK